MGQVGDGMGGCQGLPVMASRMAVMTSRPCLRMVEMKLMTLAQIPQGCSSNFPTWWRCQL